MLVSSLWGMQLPIVLSDEGSLQADRLRPLPRGSYCHAGVVHASRESRLSRYAKSWRKRFIPFTYADLICYAYGPPAILPLEAAVFTERFVTSMVLGLEVVPRLSVRALLELRAEVRQALQQTTRSKVTVTKVHLDSCVGDL